MIFDICFMLFCSDPCFSLCGFSMVLVFLNRDIRQQREYSYQEELSLVKGYHKNIIKELFQPKLAANYWKCSYAEQINCGWA